MRNIKWDVFISHASEDKESIARLLAEKLMAKGLKVWFDEHTLKLGDSLRRKIEEGLIYSRYGIVILSPFFFSKEWPNKELDVLVSMEDGNQKVILPIWHNISYDEICKHSPILASKLGISSSKGIDYLVKEILDVINPDSNEIVSNSLLNSTDNKLVTIEFNNAFEIDPVSLQMAIYDFFDYGSLAFKVKWPQLHNKMYTNVKKLYEEARNYKLPGTAFYGHPSDYVLSFIERGVWVIEYADMIHRGIEKRVPLLLKEMRSHLKPYIKVSLENLLMISNYEVQCHLSNVLSYSLFNDKYFPSEWMNDTTGNSDKLRKNMLQKLFQIREPLCFFKLSKVANMDVPNDYFWVPKSMMIEICKAHDFKVNCWYVHYLIPQFELYLAKNDNSDIILYDNTAQIYNIVDDKHNDIDMFQIF